MSTYSKLEYIQHDRQMKGRIHSFETFGTVDGPGIRFVLFMQGCALRCQFCHNPDTWDMTIGQALTVDEVIAEIEPYIPYYTASGGGVTFSGGEPSLQAPFLAALGRELKRRFQLHITMDSSGFCEPSHLDSTGLLNVLDLIMLDLKMIDEQKHINLTSQSNERILRFARFIADAEVRLWIRHVIIPSVTNDETDLMLLGRYIEELATVELIELLAYHEMGKYKWEQLQLPYALSDIVPPSADEMSKAKELIAQYCTVPIRI